MRMVEETSRRLEPRLAGVRVTLAETDADSRRQLRFMIEGCSGWSRTRSRSSFDTVLEIASGSTT